MGGGLRGAWGTDGTVLRPINPACCTKKQKQKHKKKTKDEKNQKNGKIESYLHKIIPLSSKKVQSSGWCCTWV